MTLVALSKLIVSLKLSLLFYTCVIYYISLLQYITNGVCICIACTCIILETVFYQNLTRDFKFTFTPEVTKETKMSLNKSRLISGFRDSKLQARPPSLKRVIGKFL